MSPGRSQDEVSKEAKAKKEAEQNRFHEALIEAVRGRRAIYDKKHKFYKDPHYKSNLWREISNDVSRSKEECESEWGKLKESYRRERKLQERPSGSGRDNRKPFQFYGLMAWLDSHISVRRVKSSESRSQDSENSMDVTESSLDTTLDTSQAELEEALRNPSKFSQSRLMELLQKGEFVTVFEKKQEEEDAEMTLFGQPRRSSTPNSDDDRSDVKMDDGCGSNPDSPKPVTSPKRTPLKSANQNVTASSDSDTTKSHLKITSPHGTYRARAKSSAAFKRGIEESMELSMKKVASAMDGILEQRKRKARDSPGKVKPVTFEENLASQVGEMLLRVENRIVRLKFRSELAELLNRIELHVIEQEQGNDEN